MQDRALYSIQEARKLLGGISRNTIYRLLRTGQLASVVIGCGRFISSAAIAELVASSTTTISPIASLHTIAPDSPSGSSPATTYLPSKPDCAGSELISCAVASVCLRYDPLGTRHP
jgi:excisionase family DNA binding protein